jgi:hypothetical protein
VVHPVRLGATGQERVLETAVEAFYHHVRLRVVCCRLGMLDVEQVAQGGPQGGGELGPAVRCDDSWDPRSAHQPSLKQSIHTVYCCDGGYRCRFWLAGGPVHEEQVDETF